MRLRRVLTGRPNTSNLRARALALLASLSSDDRDRRPRLPQFGDRRPARTPFSHGGAYLSAAANHGRNPMRKLITAIALSALATGLMAAPSAIAVKAPKPVPATVTVVPTPTTIAPETTNVNVSGNVSATSSCRKDRTVRFAYVNTTTSVVTPLAETAVTGS